MTNHTEHTDAPSILREHAANVLWEIACEWRNPITQRADAAARLVELVDSAGITPRGLQSNVVRSACATVLATAWRRRNIREGWTQADHDRAEARKVRATEARAQSAEIPSEWFDR